MTRSTKLAFAPVRFAPVFFAPVCFAPVFFAPVLFAAVLLAAGCEEEPLGPQPPIPLPARMGAPMEATAPPAEPPSNVPPPQVEPPLQIEPPPPQPNVFPVDDAQDDDTQDEGEDGLEDSGDAISPQQVIRECDFADRCVVERLERRPHDSRTLPFLIEAHRNLGNVVQSRALMTEYLRRFGTGGEAERYRRLLPASGSNGAPGVRAPATAPRAQQAATPQQIMRECNFANRCVAERLEEGPKNATTLPFLIEAYRNLGNTSAEAARMRQYVQRYPNGAHASRYQRMLD